MKATGIVRRIDDLGRVVIPKEIRRTFGIAEGDPLEIFVDGGSIVLKKYTPGCIFSGSSENLIHYNGKQISREAATEIAKAAGLI
ncbi:AbrB/MazE/SpoVT family DNA-binding domain-containing protein [Paenibacillus sp. FSL H8-0034]|uniref:AbrB/MazE/SpoVT family DNA-binding domain-containing protein n=1 Tax=Paenibacillus sp. FSL H8-0034 TaxID=2954671 RepID=UPI0030F74860